MISSVQKFLIASNLILICTCAALLWVVFSSHMKPTSTLENNASAHNSISNVSVDSTPLNKQLDITKKAPELERPLISSDQEPSIKASKQLATPSFNNQELLLTEQDLIDIQEHIKDLPIQNAEPPEEDVIAHLLEMELEKKNQVLK